MEKVNYINHLNIVLEMFHNDERIKQGHITFIWHFFSFGTESFLDILTINLELIMERAKFKSKTTYHKHL